MKQCKNCRSNVDDNFRFCPNCGGTDFSEPEEEIIQEKEEINLPMERDEEEKNVVQRENPEEEQEIEVKNAKQLDKRKIYWISGIVVAVIVVVLLLFLGHKDKNEDAKKENKKKDNKIEIIDNKKEYTEEEKNQNDVLLLEYAAANFDGRTDVWFSDMTHNGLDELFVYDDTRYTNPDLEPMTTILYIYSVLDEKVTQIDEIDTCGSLYLYKEDSQYYLIEEYGDNYVLSDESTSKSGKANFRKYYYDKNGEKIIEDEAEFEKDDIKSQWSETKKDEAKQYMEKVISYVLSSEYQLASYFGWCDSMIDSQMLPPYIGEISQPLNKMCEIYELSCSESTDTGKDTTSNVIEEEIVGLAIDDISYDLNARVGNGAIYYSVEDDYIDSLRINKYNLTTGDNTEIYYTSSYPTIGYVYPYKGALYGVGENRIYRVYGDGSNEPLFEKIVLPGFSIMDDVIYYLSDMRGDIYILQSYDLVSGSERDIFIIPKNREDYVRIFGVTKSYVLIRINEEIQVIGKNGTDTGIRLERDKVRMSRTETDCIYKEKEGGGITKVNLVSGEETDILTSADLMTIFGVDKAGSFDFLENDLYIIVRGVLYKVDIVNKSAEEIVAGVDDVITDKGYLLLSGTSKAEKYYMQYGIPLYCYEPEEGIKIIE